MLPIDIPFASPLNKAHHHQRKANSCLNRKKFDESLKHHEKAAGYLCEAIKLTSCSEAATSLKLQYNFHIHEIKAVTLKKQQAEIMSQKLLKKLEEEISDSKKNDEPLVPPKSIDLKADELQLAIYRTIDDQDSLLQFLYKQPKDSEEKSSEKSYSDLIKSAVKTPKDDKMLIEELKMNNNELKKLINTLMKELDFYQTENNQLRDIIKNYEKSDCSNNKVK